MVIEVQGERGGQLYGYRGTGRERGSCMVIEVQRERERRGAAVWL